MGPPTMSVFDVSHVICEVCSLCIAALEYQNDEIELPEASKILENCYFLTDNFERTERRLYQAAHISDTNPEQRLQDYLGSEAYAAYNVKINALWSDISSLAETLGFSKPSSQLVREIH